MQPILRMGARAAVPAAHRVSAPVRAAAPQAVLPCVQVRFASAKASKDAFGVTPAPGQAGHAKMWEGVVKDCVATPCTLAFAALEDVDLAKKKKVAIVGTKASLDALANSGLLPAKLQEGFELVVSKLKAKPLKIATMTHLVSGARTEELVVGCVTDVAGRNSSQHRGDQVRQFVKMVDAKENTGLVLAVPNVAGVFAYTSSAPKGHSLCDLKGENDGFKAKNRETMQTAVWVATGEQVTEKQLTTAQIVGESVQLAARLVDMPANYLNTKTYSQIAQGLAKRFGFDVNVIQGEELQKQGMNVIFSVGRAAEYSSALVTCSYAPKKGKSQEVVCWAGKGVVYDTGGLSLKPSNAMSGMKRDMGGSASALGAFVAAVRLETTRPLHCLLGLADNAVSGASLRPDDIVRSLSGKTIEINNTDAEGRLVLCDTVAYAHKTFKPNTLVDLATLTGAQGIATGKHFAAIMGNKESIEQEAIKAGKDSGDQCFPVVWAPEFQLHDYDSKIADMTNLQNDTVNASVSSAGLFIHEVGFAGKYKGKWLHIDMAYPVEAEGRGTGWGVGLLLKMIKAA